MLFFRWIFWYFRYFWWVHIYFSEYFLILRYFFSECIDLLSFWNFNELFFIFHDILLLSIIQLIIFAFIRLYIFEWLWQIEPSILGVNFYLITLSLITLALIILLYNLHHLINLPHPNTILTPLTTLILIICCRMCRYISIILINIFVIRVQKELSKLNVIW